MTIFFANNIIKNTVPGNEREVRYQRRQQLTNESAEIDKAIAKKIKKDSDKKKSQENRERNKEIIALQDVPNKKNLTERNISDFFNSDFENRIKERREEFFEEYKQDEEIKSPILTEKDFDESKKLLTDNQYWSREIFNRW